MKSAGWLPHDPERSAAQIDWVTAACRGLNVLDLGCGDGRIAAALAGHVATLYVLDEDEDALGRCVAACQGRARPLHADMCLPPLPTASVDRVLCLGNTFSLLWQVDRAVAALRTWRGLLSPGGVVVIDDLADDLWPELAQGRWSAGVDDARETQLVWQRDDAVFAIRTGPDIDDTCWDLCDADVPMRLWTAGSLHLAAVMADLAPPERHEAGGVLVLRVAPAAR